MSNENITRLQEIRESYIFTAVRVSEQLGTYSPETAFNAVEVFDQWVNQVRAEAKAEALNEAADALTREDVPDGWGIPTYENYGNWLRARASQLKESK